MFKKNCDWLFFQDNVLIFISPDVEQLFFILHYRTVVFSIFRGANFFFQSTADFISPQRTTVYHLASNRTTHVILLLFRREQFFISPRYPVFSIPPQKTIIFISSDNGFGIPRKRIISLITSQRLFHISP